MEKKWKKIFVEIAAGEHLRAAMNKTSARFL